MKQIFFFFLAVISIASCDREEDKGTFDGRWNLVQVYGGFAGSEIEVDWDHIEIVNDDIAVYKGDTKLFTAEIDSWEEVDGLQKANMSFNTENDVFAISTIKYFEFSEDLFVISDECCDLYTYAFEEK